MSRHRIVRSMNYNDEYDGYDDVYGHSVEDEYSISPSDEAEFMYDRTRQPQMSAFFNEGEDIVEEDELETDGGESQRRDSSNYKWPRLSDTDEARLRSCLEEIRNVVGECVPEHVLVETVLKCDFDVHRSLDQVLQYSQAANNSAPAATDGPKPQRQIRVRNRERDDDSPECFLDVKHSAHFLKQSLEIIQIRTSNNIVLKSSVFNVSDGAVFSFSNKYELFPPTSKTISNKLELTSCKNCQGRIEHIFNRLNTVVERENYNENLLVDSKFYNEKVMIHDNQVSMDNCVISPRSREPPKLSIPKFQMKVRRDSDKENDQDLLHSSLKMESDIEGFSPPSSDDEDDGLSSLSALAKQHQSAGHVEKTVNQPFRTFPAPGGVFSLKVGHGSVEGPVVARDESSSEKCFSSLADLIASHLSTSDSSPRVPNKRLAFPRVPVTRTSASGSDSSSCSPSHEVDDVIIDLTCALKINTIKHVQDEVTSKHEEAPPISLDLDETETLTAADAECLSCLVNASEILQQTFPLRMQEPSAFGKILCRKWRRLPLPRVLHRSKSMHTVKHFAFDCPSPDDAILKIRQRK